MTLVETVSIFISIRLVVPEISCKRVFGFYKCRFYKIIVSSYVQVVFYNKSILPTSSVLFSSPSRSYDSLTTWPCPLGRLTGTCYLSDHLKQSPSIISVKQAGPSDWFSLRASTAERRPRGPGSYHLSNDTRVVSLLIYMSSWWSGA